MTPNDIATSISGLRPVGEASVSTSRMPTYCMNGNSYVPDDQNDWD